MHTTPVSDVTGHLHVKHHKLLWKLCGCGCACVGPTVSLLQCSLIQHVQFMVFWQVTACANALLSACLLACLPACLFVMNR
jgi:hypothetical protein